MRDITAVDLDGRVLRITGVGRLTPDGVAQLAGGLRTAAGAGPFAVLYDRRQVRPHTVAGAEALAALLATTFLEAVPSIAAWAEVLEDRQLADSAVGALATHAQPYPRSLFADMDAAEAWLLDQLRRASR